MKNFSVKEITVSEIGSITCDVCGMTYAMGVAANWESQEFLHIKAQGGYSSIFGDGTIIECDICQHWLKKLLGDYLRITENHP